MLKPLETQEVVVSYKKFVELVDNSRKFKDSQEQLASADRTIGELLATIDEYEKLVERHEKTIEALDEAVDVLWEELVAEELAEVEIHETVDIKNFMVGGIPYSIYNPVVYVKA